MEKSAKNEYPQLCLWLFRFGVGFILLSALLFLLGFATNYWYENDIGHYGLWESCQHGACASYHQQSLPDYHIASQALQITATIIYTLSPVVHYLLYCGKKKKSTDFRTRILELGFSTGMIFHFASLLVFGLKLPESPSWSYNMSAAALGLGFVGVLLLTTSRKRALRAFRFLPRKQRDNKIGPSRSISSGSSRAQTPQIGTPTGTRNIIFGPPRPLHLSQAMQPRSLFSTESSRLPYPHNSLTSQDLNINHPNITPNSQPSQQNTDYSAVSTQRWTHLPPLRVIPSAPPIEEETV